MASKAISSAASAISSTSLASSLAKSALPHTAIPQPFVPRDSFPVSQQIVRSYFLGHHHSTLERMRRTVSTVSLIIEVRDARIPLTSWNPLLESTLSATNSPDRSRIIVYTKRDLIPDDKATRAQVNLLSRFHGTSNHASAVVFLGAGQDPKPVLDAVRRAARDQPSPSFAGTRALVVGMPNAGKSTLLNRLRARGMGRHVAKAARTGAQPGVTRKMGTPVRIVDGVEDDGDGAVYVVDTPGVFVPYVSDPISMLKLALVGCVKDGLVPGTVVADYLLYVLNRRDPGLYAKYCGPTNDVEEFLAGVARRTGKLLKGGVLGMDRAADWIVQEWRGGNLGRFCLDEVSEDSLAEAVRLAREPVLSMNQAVKKEKSERKARGEAKWAAMQGG
ncbi:p-loop containing nucleoside triphosphate hydrolase protein [Coniochaeta hoffmannii]|uniref:P-loop containing nucleoside triphosphate hydrolase protein n=1 Tax=Coniochaeta hoffmannii TaxID=91930 RepID=A0AA38RPN4_9PEZI|nr:p-loop containing nucleoside triphosphate hydrolase protein [Coniochaeta hoffmannii]